MNFAESMMYQAPKTMEVYLSRGITAIDNHLGEGYAKKHPELLAAFIQGCAQDFDTAMRVNGGAE